MYNVLSFNGGAIYVVGLARSLKVLSDHGMPVSKMNSMALAGNSAGAIVAGLLATGADEYEIEKAVLESVTKAMVKWPWYQRAFKLPVLDHRPLEDKLKFFFSETRMSDLKKPLYITAVPTNTNRSWKVFDRSDKVKLWQAVRASTSAPPYYQPIVIDGVEYIDGGFGRNNPSEVLINAVKSKLGVDLKDVYCINWRTGGTKEGKALGPTGYIGAGKFLIDNFISIGEDCSDYSMHTRLKEVNSSKESRYFSFCPMDTAKAGFFDLDKIDDIIKMWEKYTLNNLSRFEKWISKFE